ncbi:TPA: HlyD family type I secretion periplasmic adaptor subunit [Pseudomonas aeruginosa]
MSGQARLREVGAGGAALELDEKRFSRLGWGLVLLGFVGFLLWAGLAPLDKGVGVSGTVMVAGSRKAVQHPTGGLVRHIRVHEGERVEAGQVLLEMDATQARAQADGLFAQYLAALASLARLSAERDEKARIEFPAELLALDDPRLPTLLEQQRQLHDSRRRALRLELDGLAETVAGSQAQLDGLQAALRSKEQQRAALEEQLRGLRQLASEGYVPRNRLLDSERLLAQVNGEIAGDLGSLGSTRRQILELRLRMAQRREKFQEEVRASLADAQVRAEELRNRLASARFDLANSEVRAPVAGLVVGQEVFTEGGVIAPGQQLMEILPERQPLLVDARLPVEMVDKVRVGLPVELMFSAFNQSTTPRVEGEVTLVSADRLLSSALLSASSAQALGLLDAYQLAVRHDPTFQAALHERRAGSENRAIGRAGLLPSLRYDYNKARNDSTVSQGDARVERDYRSYASTLSLEQPLFDYEAYARYRQGEAQALFADEQFRGRSQELAVRLFAAYSETLFAREQVVLAEAQRRALETQLAFNQRAFEEGEGTRTDLLETRARLSLTRAEEIAASDRAAAARRTLEAMLGQALEDRELAAPIERFPALRLQPATFEGWRQVALQRSAELGAQRYALEAAAYEVERNRAGHLPRLSLYASSSKTHSASESTYEQKYDTDSVGLRLSLPLFEGGRVSAATRQAGDKYAQAQAELDAQVASVINDLHSQFDLTASSLAKVRAYEMAVAAAREQVTATRRSVAGGERVNRDVLDAEQQFYGARRDLAEARYAYLNAWLRLRQLAGVLEDRDLAVLAAYFGAGEGRAQVAAAIR